jgi:PRD1 phage membrane DNA delivery
MNEMWTSLVTIATAIVGIAILAVLVSRNAQTPAVIGAAAQGFAADIGAAVSPVTGGSSFSGGGLLSGGADYPPIY